MCSFPLVSVIIPNYNHADFLRQRIESVLKQTYSNFEVFLLDDGSTDGSLEILNQYEEYPRVKAVISNGKNTGSVFRQWVKGINLATGKYLWIAESDDFAHETFLEETVKLAEEHDNAGLVFTDSFNIDEHGNVKGKVSERHTLISSIEQEFYWFDDHTKVPDYFIDNMLILNASSVLFDLKKLRERVDLEQLEQYKNTGDQFAYIALYLKHKMIYLNRPLNYRRIHGRNTTALNFENGIIYKERIDIINYFFSALMKFPASKQAFNNYLRQNFLKVTDFGLFQEIEKLLNRFYKAGYLSFQKYLLLKLYTLITRIAPKQHPYKFRYKIKKVLRNK
ncbi:Glycosyltransferase involved in cell wall bisynthesis [Salinimicrobium sediminis]|uniref:Glycosyltransferase involved in cell wall bisynthesis n=1 Tax=Salinimicrobium sediminis TaxID=1343891 RepID=A0A285X2H4_9FLAO|nr:glycosyltransferase family 2 protein [Salinimicrobium sediminis]SOC78569.1 Glycosyltransferase involved in cell wall bisynthesis [Salinimicrobium sediminis]